MFKDENYEERKHSNREFNETEESRDALVGALTELRLASQIVNLDDNPTNDDWNFLSEKIEEAYDVLKQVESGL